MRSCVARLNVLQMVAPTRLIILVMYGASRASVMLHCSCQGSSCNTHERVLHPLRFDCWSGVRIRRHARPGRILALGLEGGPKLRAHGICAGTPALGISRTQKGLCAPVKDCHSILHRARAGPVSRLGLCHHHDGLHDGSRAPHGRVANVGAVNSAASLTAGPKSASTISTQMIWCHAQCTTRLTMVKLQKSCRTDPY